MKPHFSLQGYQEIKLTEAYIKGGLVFNLQKIALYYYPATPTHSAKVVLKMCMVKKDTKEEVEKPFSIRFDQFFDMQDIIDALQVGKVKLGKATGFINEKTVEFRIQEDIKKIREAYKQ